MPDVDPETKYYNPKTKALEWRCKYCPKRYSLSGRTRIIMAYLLNKHEISDRTYREITTTKRQLSIKESITTREQHPRLRRRLNKSGDYMTIQGDPLEILFIRLLATGNLPTSLVQSEEFHDFVYYLSRDAEGNVPNIKTLLFRPKLS